MVYTIQDKQEDKLQYIATVTSRLAAEDLIKELLEQDEKDGDFDPNRYVVTKRGICYSDSSRTCGYCTNSVCMSDDWEKECPARVRAASKGATQGVLNGGLMSAT